MSYSISEKALGNLAKGLRYSAISSQNSEELWSSSGGHFGPPTLKIESFNPFLHQHSDWTCLEMCAKKLCIHSFPLGPNLHSDWLGGFYRCEEGTEGEISPSKTSWSSFWPTWKHIWPQKDIMTSKILPLSLLAVCMKGNELLDFWAKDWHFEHLIRSKLWVSNPC